MGDEKNTMREKENIFPNRTIAMIIGVLVTVFAAVGIVFTAVYAVEGVSYLVTQQGSKQDYEKMIAPVVMLDPPAVEAPEQLDNSVIVAAGILDIVLNGSQQDYQGDDMAVYIPATDVNAHVKKLFGEVFYQDMTIATSAYTFEYSGETQIYMVQRDVQFFSYQPKVEEIAKDGDSVILHVGYQPQGAAWGANLSDREQKPFKYMDYLLKKQNDGYVIQEIRIDGKAQNETVVSSEVTPDDSQQESSQESAAGEGASFEESSSLDVSAVS